MIISLFLFAKMEFVKGKTWKSNKGFSIIFYKKQSHENNVYKRISFK